MVKLGGDVTPKDLMGLPRFTAYLRLLVDGMPSRPFSIETLPPPEFEQVVARSLRDGTAGAGRGFVLMPSSCPYGRVLPGKTLRNYEIMIERIEAL